MRNDSTKTREEQFREIATKTAVCQSRDCPIRDHCLRFILKDYVPENYQVVSVVNLCNPKMQSEGCPQYCSDQPVRMPLGLKKMYYDMPSRLERARTVSNTTSITVPNVLSPPT